jgi:hypothetical protein
MYPQYLKIVLDSNMLIQLFSVQLRLQPVRLLYCTSVAYPGILFGGGGSPNSVEDSGQRERGSGGGSPLVRGSAQFANE